MSSISGTGLYQYFQSITSSSQTAPAAPTNATASTDSSEQPAQAAEQPHHHHHGHGAFFKKIQDAVTSALQSSQSDPSADPNKTVEDAITKVLEGDGSDSSSNGSTASSGSTTPTTTGSATNPQSSRAALTQLLQSAGIDAQQFHQDFLAAIQDARGGNANPSTALQSLPPGSLVDTTG